MGRKSVLDDVTKRTKVIKILESGGDLDAAAAVIKSSRQAIWRYAQLHADFNDAMEAARAEAERAKVAGAVGRAVVPLRVMPPHPEPSPAAASAAEVIGVDVDLVQDADDAMPRSPSGLAEITVANGLLFHWRMMHDDSAPAMLRATSSQIMAKVQFQPMMDAMARREDARAKRELAALERAETVSQDEGAAIIELPVNDTEAPGRAPRPVETGVLDAEVVDRG